MAKDSLTKFANTLYAEATEEKIKEEERFRAEKEEALKKHEENLGKRFKQELDRCIRRAEEEKFLAVSKWEVELLTRLRRTRSETFGEVIQEVREKLRAFADSDKYPEYIGRCAQKTDMFNSIGTVCIARESDFELIKRELNIDGLELEKTSDDIIGGFILKNAKLGIYADYTLEAGLLEKQEMFFDVSGLTID